jgi:transcriptional regulator with XRE-family HTH domain
LNDSEMTSEHVRAARMLLRWEQKNLAKRSGVSLPTIKRLEAKPGPLGAYASTLAAIRTAFEDEGIEFFNGEAPGVRLHRRPKRLRQSRRRTPPRRRPRAAHTSLVAPIVAPVSAATHPSIFDQQRADPCGASS